VEGFAVQTEGVNFEAIWALPEDLVQQNQIKCNDIWKVLHTYGVEAARSSIVMEVQVYL
jgi:DNA-directed RNA polymerase I subunit RPA1